MSIAYLNNEFIPLSEAKISVLDRGFIFGDGVYEVIPVYAGRLFRLKEHLQRLENSLNGIKLANPLTQTEWETILNEIIERNGGGDQSVYFQVTRGVAPRKHYFPKNTPSTIFIMSQPFVDPKPSKGIKAVTLPDSRWQHCNIKSIALLANVLLTQQAVENEAGETILIRDGYVTEGASTSVFVVKNGVTSTPPEGQHILSGITRDLVLETMRAAGEACEERPILEKELYEADEIWVTSSTREIIPVTMLNDQQVGNGQPGLIWQKAWQYYQDYKQTLRTTS